MANPTVAVLGAAGYAGAIAAQILYRHPSFELSAVTARAEAGQRLDDVHPKTRVPLELELYKDHTPDAAVVAYPHGAAAPVVAELRARGVRVVDLSADFRLRDRTTYDDWYGEHKAPEIFGQGVYGLPELNRDAVAGSDLVANPGCYPTAALLGLAPLAKAGLIGDVIIDGKSGVSGAGRGATATTHFISADENVSPYKIEGHRHTPEIEQELGALGNDVTVTFTPYLVPLAQGELVTSYVTPTRDVDADEISELFDDLYGAEPFIELRRGPVGVIDVRDTNYCRISWHHDPRTGRVIVFAAIDNLWKGAASQAVQNLNLMFGRPETEGLR
ncbi:N-acetyl-gamma-glutamyl-phosphate reductase [Solirubrobacter phytolaccae]|uniref:N-acetyl-gamma-glutamyl-phosphate reductase n=1 Tax=Solirubrobacter phytolaccae TaxID=1404360 RepID=A0A9X3NBP6_9ACTN|nr:N-acetyl-gamma-glutamyl-phosphate reductase [Solirubrobacter phytolaccae]MDA0182986.1 N-acetyl-gamma-glutamyl-phosphate reductase [Solirubrobacter phytolaccae]